MRAAFNLEGSKICLWDRVNPFPHMPIFGSSNSAENKDMISKIWTNGDTIIGLSRKKKWSLGYELQQR